MNQDNKLKPYTAVCEIPVGKDIIVAINECNDVMVQGRHPQSEEKVIIYLGSNTEELMMLAMALQHMVGTHIMNKPGFLDLLEEDDRKADMEATVLPDAPNIH